MSHTDSGQTAATAAALLTPLAWSRRRLGPSLFDGKRREYELKLRLLLGRDTRAQYHYMVR